MTEIKKTNDDIRTKDWRQWLIDEGAGLVKGQSTPHAIVLFRKKLQPNTAVRLLIKGMENEQINEVCYQMRCGVATMAIATELVSIRINSSVAIDSQRIKERLRLTALCVDARYFEFLSRTATSYDHTNAIEFRLDVDFDSDLELVELAKKRNPSTDEPVVKNVYANDLRLVSTHPQHPFNITPAEPRKLIAVLTPHQSLHLSCLAIKGYGSEHAAFIPVALEGHVKRPIVKIITPVTGQEAVQLVSVCPQRVFDLEESLNMCMDTTSDGEKKEEEKNRPREILIHNKKKNGQETKSVDKVARVKDSDQCLGSAVCTRCTSSFLPFAKSVKLEFTEKEFLLRVESVNKIPSIQLWNQAVELALSDETKVPSSHTFSTFTTTTTTSASVGSSTMMEISSSSINSMVLDKVTTTTDTKTTQVPTSSAPLSSIWSLYSSPSPSTSFTNGL